MLPLYKGFSDKCFQADKLVCGTAMLRHTWIHDGMPATITLNNNHNHSVLNAEALSFWHIDGDIRERFEQYFDLGMSASAAAEYHVQQMELLSDDAGTAVMNRADAAMNPSSSTVSYVP